MTWLSTIPLDSQKPTLPLGSLDVLAARFLFLGGLHSGGAQGDGADGASRHLLTAHLLVYLCVRGRKVITTQEIALTLKKVGDIHNEGLGLEVKS